MFYALSKILYYTGSRAYFLLVKLLSPFHARAAALWQGQSMALDQMRQNAEHPSAFTVWFHVSSLGEFEQGRPVMEALRKHFPGLRLVVTFFSPSGYENCKNNSLCDAVYYLPFESRSRAAEVIKRIDPKMAFWVKYDFWNNYLQELNTRQIPVYLLAARFRENQIFFRKWGLFQQNMLRCFKYIFTQDQASVVLLNKIHINQAAYTGDTRFDRVLQTVAGNEEIESVAAFCKLNRTTVIAGSSYKEEEQMLYKAMQETSAEWNLILAPHFVSEDRLQEIAALFQDRLVRLSEWEQHPVRTETLRVLLIDRVGLLSRIYRYGQAAIIGGGFQENGLHNILEAAAFGMPLCFGPKIKRFPEAQEMVRLSLARLIQKPQDLTSWLTFYLENETARLETAEKSRAWVKASEGAADTIMQYLLQNNNS